MTRRLRLTITMALAAAVSFTGDAVLANCQDNSPYEVRQCARGSWFAPPPVGSGSITATWWAIGFGNRLINTPPGSGNVSPDGSGFLPAPLPGVFIGVDSGLLSTLELDLVDATTIPGLGAPPGSTCLSSAANWGAPGVDSCIDVNRNAYTGGGFADYSDNYVNKYWGSTYGPYAGYGTLEAQLDPPMAVLLTESTDRFFAAAFFASAPKLDPKETDLDPGQFHMHLLVNGDANPFGPIVVPWQAVPQPHVFVSGGPPELGTSADVYMQWQPLRFIHDSSSRPCRLFDGVTPCASVSGGVGVLDQGPLIHHEMEWAPLVSDFSNPYLCSTTWTAVPGTLVHYPATQTSVVDGVVTWSSCVRLKMTFGRIPQQVFRTSPATTTIRNDNRRDAQTGRLGDLGYVLYSRPIIIGSPLVSQKATLESVEREKGARLRVVFETDAELNITGFDVVGIDVKGGRKLIGSVACKECVTGVGAAYDEYLAGAKLQGAKSVQIVIQPTGDASNVIDVK